MRLLSDPDQTKSGPPNDDGGHWRTIAPCRSQISGRYWRARFAGLPALFERSSRRTLVFAGRIVDLTEFGILDWLGRTAQSLA